MPEEWANLLPEGTAVQTKAAPSTSPKHAKRNSHITAPVRMYTASYGLSSSLLVSCSAAGAALRTDCSVGGWFLVGTMRFVGACTGVDTTARC